MFSSHPIPNQLSVSNGLPSLIELSLLLSSVNRGAILQVKENLACVQTSPISFVARGKEIGDVCTQAKENLEY